MNKTNNISIFVRHLGKERADVSIMKISKISEVSFLVDNCESFPFDESHILSCNSEGKGLWIDGRQVKGVDEFEWGKNKINSAINIFEKLSDLEDL